MKKDTRDLLKIGGIVAGGVIAWNWLSGKGGLPGLPAPGAVVGGVVTEAVETAGSMLWNIPLGVARALKAEEAGGKLYDVMTSEEETSDYFRRVQWGVQEQTGIPTEWPLWARAGLPITGLLPAAEIPHPEVAVLGPGTKTFIEEAKWRESDVFAGLVTPGEPWATIGGVTYATPEAFLEAERAAFVKAGCID